MAGWDLPVALIGRTEMQAELWLGLKRHVFFRTGLLAIRLRTCNAGVTGSTPVGGSGTESRTPPVLHPPCPVKTRGARQVCS